MTVNDFWAYIDGQRLREDFGLLMDRKLMTVIAASAGAKVVETDFFRIPRYDGEVRMVDWSKVDVGAVERMVNKL